jgi:hypothetical protein
MAHRLARENYYWLMEPEENEHNNDGQCNNNVMDSGIAHRAPPLYSAVCRILVG